MSGTFAAWQRGLISAADAPRRDLVPEADQLTDRSEHLVLSATATGILRGFQRRRWRREKPLRRGIVVAFVSERLRGPRSRGRACPRASSGHREAAHMPAKDAAAASGIYPSGSSVSTQAPSTSRSGLSYGSHRRGVRRSGVSSEITQNRPLVITGDPATFSKSFLGKGSSVRGVRRFRAQGKWPAAR